MLPLKHFPHWALLSLIANGILLLMLVTDNRHQSSLPKLEEISSSLQSLQFWAQASESPNDLGEKYALNYQQWVDLLGREAQMTAARKPANLAVLLGDSISLWFPQHLLPSDHAWLNQGISGETSGGLLRRIHLLDSTQPEIIYIMIGINDVLKGVGDNTIIANQELIVRYLKRRHPQTTIVLQSILPHSGERATWEGRDRLLEIPNERIQKLNHRLQAIANREEIIYLDLYSLFADDQGRLRMDLSTDGLHLNWEGYRLWQIAIKICSQLN